MLFVLELQPAERLCWARDSAEGLDSELVPYSNSGKLMNLSCVYSFIKAEEFSRWTYEGECERSTFRWMKDSLRRII